MRSWHLAWLFHCRPCLNWAPASGKSATQSCSEDSSSGIESWSSIAREQRSTCTVETRQDRRWLSGLSADNGVRQRQHMTRSWASKELRGSALRDYLNASVKCTAFKMALLHSISREVWRRVQYTTPNVLQIKGLKARKKPREEYYSMKLHSNRTLPAKLCAQN